jgi:hypothetical protein
MWYRISTTKQSLSWESTSKGVSTGIIKVVVLQIQRTRKFSVLLKLLWQGRRRGCRDCYDSSIGTARCDFSARASGENGKAPWLPNVVERRSRLSSGTSCTQECRNGSETLQTEIVLSSLRMVRGHGPYSAANAGRFLYQSYFALD